MHKKALVIVLFTLMVGSSNRIVANVAAQSEIKADETTSAITTPNQTFSFSIKRVREKISLTWLNLFNKKGLGDYSAQLVTERANELTYIVEHEKQQYLETCVSRYITHAGLLKEQFEAGNVSTETVLNAISGYDSKFEQERDMFPSQTAQWLLLQQAVDTTKVLSSQVQEQK